MTSWVVGGVAFSFGVCAGFVLAGMFRNTDDHRCGLCADTGNFVHDEHRPEHRWCVCLLGRMYQARAGDIDAAWLRLAEHMDGEA